MFSAQVKCLLNGINVVKQKQIWQLLKPSYYHSSPFLEDLGDVKVKYKVTADPEDWNYVKRALARTVVPNPIRKEKYPSGWKPQASASELKNQSFFVERTKNHMIPVYLNMYGPRDVIRVTKLKKIQGDIWKLEKQLIEFLQKESFQPIRRQVNEFNGSILIHGDHVNAIKYWLEQRNL